MCQYFLLPRNLMLICLCTVVFHFDRSLHLLIQIGQLRKAISVTRSFSLRYPVRLDLPWCMVCDGWVLFLFCSWRWIVQIYNIAHELVFGDIVLLLLWISGWYSYGYLEPQHPLSPNPGCRGTMPFIHTLWFLFLFLNGFG